MQAFVWVKPPSLLGKTLTTEYAARLKTGVRAIGDYIALKMMAEARQFAPWQDRTGNARSGLFAVAEATAGTLVEIYLSHGHTINYGVFLELAHGAQYAIVMPTIERNLPVIRSMLDQLFFVG